MIDRPRLLAILFTLALASLLFLYIYASSIGPVSLDVSEIGEEHTGKYVQVAGKILDVEAYTSGGASFSLADENYSSGLIIYLPESVFNTMDKSCIRPGSEVTVQGELSEYEGEIELMVESAEDIVLTAPPEEDHVEISALLQMPSIYEDMNISVNGSVEKIERYTVGSEHEVTDMYISDGDGYKLSVIAFFEDPLLEALEPGAVIEIKGTFEYYPPEGKYRISASGVSALKPE